MDQNAANAGPAGGQPSAERGSNRKARRGLSTSTLMMAGAIGVAGSILVVPLTYLQISAGLAFVQLVAATLGAWMFPCIFPLVFLRKPGVSIVACLTIGVVSSFTTPFGPSAILALLVEGFILELPFMLSLYRRWNSWLFVVSALLLGAFMGYFVASSMGVKNASAWLLLTNVAISEVSCLVFLALAWQAAKLLRRAGLGEPSQAGDSRG
ncbi:MAG: ECF transporter S component [Bifidobacteriaceae bacterium]|jgi:energy-coupling factor transport system substrate-specific component|nr:ECF transporter S component [Bifidobacteriaceae bacterium]